MAAAALTDRQHRVGPVLWNCVRVALSLALAVLFWAVVVGAAPADRPIADLRAAVHSGRVTDIQVDDQEFTGTWVLWSTDQLHWYQTCDADWTSADGADLVSTLQADAPHPLHIGRYLSTAGVGLFEPLFSRTVYLQDAPWAWMRWGGAILDGGVLVLILVRRGRRLPRLAWAILGAVFIVPYLVYLWCEPTPLLRRRRRPGWPPTPSAPPTRVPATAPIPPAPTPFPLSLVPYPSRATMPRPSRPRVTPPLVVAIVVAVLAGVVLQAYAIFGNPEGVLNAPPAMSTVHVVDP